MTKQQSFFWDAYQEAHNLILAGDKAAALHAIQQAWKVTVEVGGELSSFRLELLDALTRTIDPAHVPTAPELTVTVEEHDTPVPAADSATPTEIKSAEPQRILVSGIGRSGTTLIYQQLAKLLMLDSGKVNCRYEPYLWDVRKPEPKGNSWEVSQLSQFGMLTHSSVPLFLEGANASHDSFLDHLFNETWDRDSNQRPDSYLTKVIRGSGRLRSYLKRYPDLKIVACLRNPVDTINSSLGMFSFFGDEFHLDDRPRFRSELEVRGTDVSKLDTPPLSVEWYVKWWRVFTEETLAVAAEYPDNVMLFCYEEFLQAPNDALEMLMTFVGSRNLGMFMGLSKPAGPTIKATSLTQHDINVMKPDIGYYTDTVLKSRLGEQDAIACTDKIISRCLGGSFSIPIAGSDLGRRCPDRLRGMILNNQKSPFMSLVQRSAHPISLDDMITLHHPTDPAELRKPAAAGDTIKKGKRFGVVITCYNNAATITDAVLSCLNQTLPFDEIVVVNDKSTDGSRVLLAELGERYSCLSILDLSSNLGPSAGRDLGIRKLTTDFFTQLDGDDLFWPTKNAQEAAAIAGDESVVAFSDILLVRPEKSFTQTTSAYDGKIGTQAYQLLLARTPQIPRDMTVSRQAYFKAGGYDMMWHLYEDWDFKLRLAVETKAWIRADGLAGTIYNRLSPGLSGVQDGEHARALSQIFLSALKNSTHIPLDKVLPAFDAAIGGFKERYVAACSRATLETCIAQDCGLDGIADLALRRDMRAADNTRYSAAIDAFARKFSKTKEVV